MSDQTIMIMAGGTGGHIYPALAVADVLRDRGFKLCWLGTNQGLEASIVPRQGYPLLTISVSGVRGKGIIKLCLTPFMLVFALMQALLIIRRVKPNAVLGLGGFASGPGGLAAWILRVPLLIHEQNAIAGLTNRMLEPLAIKVMAAFPNVFRKTDKLVITGNPIRKEIASVPLPQTRFKNRDLSKLKILVLGGSLGARRLNEVIPQALTLLEGHEYQVRHQCGRAHIQFTQECYEKAKVDAEIMPFIENMAEAYAWADLVICRAGALTVAELAGIGVGSILIPYPHAVDDHQTSNAAYLSDKRAAILIQESQLNTNSLKDILLSLYRAPEQLLQMAIKARELALPQATEMVADRCMEVACA